MCCSESTTAPDKKLLLNKWKTTHQTNNKTNNHTRSGKRQENISCSTNFDSQRMYRFNHVNHSDTCLKSYKIPRSSEHLETKGTGKSYLAELLLKPPIPCEVCTRAVPSGSREHLQPCSGIGQTRGSKVHKLNINELLHMDTICSWELWQISPDSFYTKAQLHTWSPCGRSQDLYPGLGCRVKWPWHLTRGSCSSPGEKSVQPSACTSISCYLFVITVGEKNCITWDMKQKGTEYVPWGNYFHQGPAPSRYC